MSIWGWTRIPVMAWRLTQTGMIQNGFPLPNWCQKLRRNCTIIAVPATFQHFLNNGFILGSPKKLLKGMFGENRKQCCTVTICWELNTNNLHSWLLLHSRVFNKSSVGMVPTVFFSKHLLTCLKQLLNFFALQFRGPN